MTLSFTQQINGKPNYFIEKIWASILENNFENRIQYGYHAGQHNDAFDKFWDGFLVDGKDLQKPKLHTIREDKSNRWRAGMDIHLVINNRTPNRFQFAPVIKCVSVQKIEIIPMDSIELLDLHLEAFTAVKVDGKILRIKEIQELAINDGFDSVEDFFAYFNKDFTGILIHWTDKRY